MESQEYITYTGVNVPIKSWTQGLPIDSGALSQLIKASKLPFIYKHIAVMPDVHIGIGATIGSVIPTKGAIIPAAVGVDIGCFSGDTKVPLLKGRQATLKELASTEEEVWIYSYDIEKGHTVPGKAKGRRTRENANLMKVIVSGGEDIICTPDHQFLNSSSEYVEARNLKINESLMPLYRKWDRDGYELISSGSKTRATHRLFYESYYDETLFKGYVVHHRNHNVYDNTPDNLELMLSGDHTRYHREINPIFKNDDPEFQKLRQEGTERRLADPVKLQQMADVGTANITNYMRDNPDHYKEAVSQNGMRGSVYLSNFNTSEIPCKNCNHVAKNPAALRWHNVRDHGKDYKCRECDFRAASPSGIKSHRNQAHINTNHKVLEIQYLDRKEDVYCLQVEKYHNFALSAGVFVHNCGMMATRLSGVNSSHLPDSLSIIRAQIESKVPVGFSSHSSSGMPREDPRLKIDDLTSLLDRHNNLRKSIKKEPARQVRTQYGTLGGGNHFIELCLDENEDVWVMLHSGSRGIGNKIGTYFISLAKKDMERFLINLPDKDLAYFPEGTDHFDDYYEAVLWAQNYAALNRQQMMRKILEVLQKSLPEFDATVEAISCHHNYVEREHHFGSNVLVTRKGAVRARKGDLGIIPGSMGAKSYIVKGKGCEESFNSCSHGAGRAMSRSQARRTITLEEHLKAVDGVECRKDSGAIDESPGAYKDIDKVMKAQEDLVEVVHTLKQVLCVKG